MKKILLLFIVFSNILLFSSVHDIYKEKDVSDIYNMYGFKTGKIVTSLDFKNEIGSLDKKQFLETIVKISHDQQVMFYVEEEDYEKSELTYYISYAKPLNQAFHLVSNQALVLGKSRSFYSNQEGKGVPFYTINKDWNFSFHSLLDLSNKKTPVTTLLMVGTQKHTEQALKKITSQYGKYLQEASHTTQDHLNTRQALSKSLQPLLFMSLAVVVIILLMYTDMSSEKIGIMKMEGYNHVDILMALYRSITLMIIIVPIIVLTLLFFILLKQINYVTLSMGYALMKYVLIEIVGLIACIGINYLVILTTSFSLLIKQAKQNKYLLNINFIIKIICVIGVISMFTSGLQNVRKDFILWNNLQKYGYYYRSAQSIEGLKEGYQNDGYDLVKYTSGQYDHMYEVYQKNYDIANKLGAFYFERQEVTVGDQEMSVFYINSNYLNAVKFLDHNGQRVSIDNSKKEITLLVPESKKSIPISDYILDEKNTVSTIHIKDNQSYIDYSMLSNRNVVNNPIFIVYSDQANRVSKTLFSTMYFTSHLEMVLEKTGYKGKVSINSGKHEYQSEVNYLNKQFSKDLTQILFPSILIILIIVQYCHMYLKCKKEKIAVKELLGFDYLHCYLDLYIENLIVYLLPLVLLLFTNKRLIGILVFAMMDIIITSLFIIITKNQSIITILKEGAE